MRKVIGVVLMVLSLVCIIVTVVQVATGKTGLWSTESIGAYIFHPFTMVIALWLLAGKGREPLTEPKREGGG